VSESVKRINTERMQWIAFAVVLATVVAGPAAVVPVSAATSTTASTNSLTSTSVSLSGDWQARLSSKVLEWMSQTDIDYGFSIAYRRDLSHPASLVGPFPDGRGLATDPAAYATFPAQSGPDLGLRIFLDQIYSKNGSLEVILQALEQQGSVRMLAEPTLVLKKASGDATVRTGSRIPYAAGQVAGVNVAEVTLFQDTGVALKVSFVDVVKLDDTYAVMKIVSDVTSLAGYVSVSLDAQGTPRRVPQVTTRMIENTVLIRDKTTLIAGILKEDTKGSNAQGPPILGDIPFIKHLFRNRSQTKRTHEILFLVNVDLIPPGAM